MSTEKTDIWVERDRKASAERRKELRRHHGSHRFKGWTECKEFQPGYYKATGRSPNGHPHFKSL